MRKAIDRCFVVWILLVLLPTDIFPQREASIPFRKQEGFVLEFKPPYDRIAVDVGVNNFIEAESVTVEIPASTPFVNRKNKQLDRGLIRPGTRLEISGERYGTRVVASSIKVLTDLEKWEIGVKGYFESLDGDKAWIDGQAVKLAPGVRIRGDDKWTGQTYASFNDVPAGCELKVEGIRRADGIVYANSVAAEPNEFTNSDRNLKMLVEKSLVLPATLTGGKGTVAGREVKFVDDLDLQTYVTKVGNRLVPRYQKDLPADFPGKLVYRFAVIEDESFNAFALPDGSVFVHTGLLKQIKNEAQLASILGHEIAHITHEHGRKQLQDAQNKQWLAVGAALGGAMIGSKEASAAGLIFVGALQNKYSRDKEDQADRVGLYYMSQAGYDPREAPKVWREVSKNTRTDVVSNFLYSDHSSARERLKHMNREIAYNYYDTDYSKTKIGANEYMDVVGVYFGWKPRPIVPIMTKAFVGSTPKGKGSAKKPLPAARFVRGLPGSVNTFLNTKYRGWRFATVGVSCVAEFRKSKVSGDFNGDGKIDYAVKFNTARRGYIVAFVSGPSDFTPYVLEDETLATMRNQGLAFARKGESYAEIIDEDFNRTTRILATDSPVGGTCESSSYMYVWMGNGFRRAFTSD